MNQLSLFEPAFEPTIQVVRPEPETQSNIIPFCKKKKQPQSTPTRPNNSVKGQDKTVYPLKDRNDILNMAQWLRENKGDRYMMAFILGINLGLRANELLSLRRNDLFNPDGSIKFNEQVDTPNDKIRIHQKKTHSDRDLYLNEDCVNVLNMVFPHRLPGFATSQYIFPSREGGHIEVDTLRKVLKEAAKACGIKQNIGSHTMRKTFGYWHFQKYHDVVFLQNLFRHSDALITMRYIGMAAEDDKAAYHAISFDICTALKENPRA